MHEKSGDESVEKSGEPPVAEGGGSRDTEPDRERGDAAEASGSHDTRVPDQEALPPEVIARGIFGHVAVSDELAKADLGRVYRDGTGAAAALRAQRRGRRGLNSLRRRGCI